MAPNPDPASLSAHSRRCSISAIPRPKSGTSRHATPIGPRGDRRDSAAGTRILNIGHKYRKSWHPEDSVPPSSFRMRQPQVANPGNESLLPDKQRSHHDLSGTQQQLYVRTLSTQSLSGPDAVVAPHQLKQTSSTTALPKSKTMSSLLSSPRETITRRRLLQPLEPPLPQTQTLGNISCFGPLSETPSPRKPISVSLSPPQRHCDNGSHLSAADALVESRMTEKERDLMIRVQREAAINRARLRNSCQHRNPLEYPLAQSTKRTNEQTATLKLSLNDVANTQRVEGMKRTSSSGRLLFINSTLANKHWRERDLPTSTTMTTSIGSITSSIPSQGSDSDPRHVRDHQRSCTSAAMLTVNQVYVAEHASYWTGRYVSICDRLRTKELNVPPPSPSESSEKKTDRLFDNGERVRMNNALNELREHCKTEEALKSFDDFENALLKKIGISRQSLRRAGSLAFAGKGVERKQGISESSGSRLFPLNMSNSPGNASTPTSRISSVNADAVPPESSKLFYGEGAIAKSKTTGNLAALIPLIPLIPKRQYVVASSSLPKSNTVQPLSHRRKTSYFDCSPETRAKAMKEREERASRRAAEAHRRSSSHMPVLDVTKSRGQSKDQGSSSRVVKISEAAQSQVNSSTSKIDASGAVADSLSAAMLENGYVPPPPNTMSTDLPSRVELVELSGGGKGKVVKSRRKTERQISGEMVKILFGAGMREAKRMGRRVSGMSWPRSSDELITPRSGSK
ncbi:uncharacterized protein Z519_10234 [Cladophialophora bantiana CBS 173.52]|uniref:Uncharacterized protein n=1 Tax=Cladophialophora bantiana (strain ATCC 10958 / CBS 173.52 / CDC B-1940 / NIH 8579) TaxID=1442370 RepID=A0A0D2HF19_CLAB1|nr:uncharacterized protein Z519_10234 [Cladophialophora bantiana CBS 173.52]KIW89380.1 hypothetical protein Z519_10234 [Cladophialophora bantiana CBS 173.52]